MEQIENFILITGIGCLILFLVLTINTIIYIKKNKNVKIDKIIKNLSFRITLSIILMIVIGFLSIIFIILRNYNL